jgi:hypothetical protein
MSALNDSLQRLAEQLRKRLPHVRGEESTKQALIVPFLSTLGYDVYDPSEVQPEYVADFAKKRSGGPSEKVDYAIQLGGAPVIFIECKAADVDLAHHSGQLARYFNSTPSCPVAILTNGIRYHFFTDLEEKNILGQKPFFEFDMFGFSEADVELLEAFSREQFNPTTVREQAEEIIYTSKISGFINMTLRDPSESFTRFVLAELGVFVGKKITARVIEKFTPTIKRAIQATLLDMATRSIKQQSQPSQPSPLPPQPPPIAKPSGDDPKASGDKVDMGPKIVTTAEELDALEIVKVICADSPLSGASPILYKDTASWFTISTISIRRWFVRLYFNQKRHSILTNISPEQTKALCPGFETDGSRVFINNNKDLLRLRPLILLAYEGAARHHEPTPEDEPS